LLRLQIMAAALQNAQFWEASAPAGLGPTSAQAGIRATGATGDCHDASPLVRHVSDLPTVRSWAH
jgi:hypothetical protein